MASSIGGYRSPVDLGLGQQPQTQDPLLFNEFTEVYNAIHLLNQYLDQLRVVAEGGSGSGELPSDSMPFNRFYTATALVNITVGQPVSPSPVTGDNGIVLGALASISIASNNPDGTPRPLANPSSNFCGIALTSALAGDTLRVGVGPAIIQFPGILSGQLLWAYSSRATNGNRFGDGGLYIGDPGVKTTPAGTAYPMPVATCPLNGFALFGQFLSGP